MARAKKEAVVESLLENTDVDVVGGSPVNSDRPSPTSYEWHDYVISLLQKDEIVDGRPTADGLRRVAQLLIAPIESSESKLIQFSADPYSPFAIVQHTIYIGGRTFTDLAEVNERNTELKFRPYAVATAATRAEGRCLRKLLSLRKILTDEEIGNVPPPEEHSFGEKINASQLNFLNILGKRLDVDLWGYINSGTFKYKNIAEIPYETAAKMTKRLSEIQTEQKPIDKALQGYKDNWQIVNA